jgi:hypothetical protein
MPDKPLPITPEALRLPLPRGAVDDPSVDDAEATLVDDDLPQLESRSRLWPF